jgi:hypothetical protein
MLVNLNPEQLANEVVTTINAFLRNVRFFFLEKKIVRLKKKPACQRSRDDYQRLPSKRQVFFSPKKK